MPFPRATLALLLVLLAAPVWAVKDWYDYYEEGQKQALRGQCKEALANLARRASMEASVMTFNNLFLIMACCFAVMLFMLPLVRKPKAAPPPDAH